MFDVPKSGNALAMPALSHNLNGQRLGRKGRDTRARILAAVNEILREPEEFPISLTAVAKRVPLGMTALYSYFTDLTELLLAVLEPVMETAEATYLSNLREYWGDEELGDRALLLVQRYHAFWATHTRILHLRNSMAENGDRRMMLHRVRSAQEVMRLFVMQMDGGLDQPTSRIFAMATALMTGLDRVATVTTDAKLPKLLETPIAPREHLLDAQARLIEFGIRDYRNLSH